jgi:hypothetical protein
MGPAAAYVLPNLTRLLKAKEDYVRASAADALYMMRVLAVPAVPALTGLLWDKDGGVRSSASSAIRNISVALQFECTKLRAGQLKTALQNLEIARKAFAKRLIDATVDAEMFERQLSTIREALAILKKEQAHRRSRN